MVPIHLLHVEELIRQIRSDTILHDIKIMVGGPAFILSDNLLRQIGADALVMNGNRRGAVCRRLLEDEFK